MTHVFVAHQTSVNLIHTYSWVIAMESTYKTNMYKMSLFEMVGMTSANMNFLIGYAIMKDETEESYRWVLEKLTNVIGNHLSPMTIVTDRELGLLRSIREVFPSSAHLLCTRHINNDVLKRVYDISGKNTKIAERFTRGRWRKVMNSTIAE